MYVEGWSGGDVCGTLRSLWGLWGLDSERWCANYGGVRVFDGISRIPIFRRWFSVWVRRRVSFWGG